MTQRALRATLAPDEVERASRFRFDRDRRRYVVARGALRSILSGLVGLDPSDLTFAYAAAGKPELDTEAAALAGGVADSNDLRFNVSHSHELALIAVGRGRRMGVDVEWIRPLDDLEGMAERFFSEGERSDVVTLSGEARTLAFFTCWTRKEAYVKATGKGITVPLDRFRVSALPGAPARLLHTMDDPSEAERWRLAEVPCGAGYVGALAVEGHRWRLVQRSWKP